MSRIRYIPESIQGAMALSGVMDGASHTSDGDLNVLNANRNDDGQWLNTYWDNPDNQCNDNKLETVSSYRGMLSHGNTQKLLAQIPKFT